MCTFFVFVQYLQQPLFSIFWLPSLSRPPLCNSIKESSIDTPCYHGFHPTSFWKTLSASLFHVQFSTALTYPTLQFIFYCLEFVTGRVHDMHFSHLRLIDMTTGRSMDLVIGENTMSPAPLSSPFKIIALPAILTNPINAAILSSLKSWSSVLPPHCSFQLLKVLAVSFSILSRISGWSSSSSSVWLHRFIILRRQVRNHDLI